MKLCWDGLEFTPPEDYTPVELSTGFVHLTSSSGKTIDLRFGMVDKNFQPDRDGRRLLAAARIPVESIQLCQDPWVESLAGKLFGGSRLWVLQWSKQQAVLAVLFSFAPSREFVSAFFSSVTFTCPGKWRTWRFHGLSFATPPELLLTKVDMQPGRIRLSFAQKYTTVVIERLNPANVLIDKENLLSWGKRNLTASLGSGIEFRHQLDEENIEFYRPPSWRYRLAPGIVQQTQPLAGSLRHQKTTNSLLLIVAQGKPMDSADWRELQNSYVTLGSE
jgi:hypothetical protein